MKPTTSERAALTAALSRLNLELDEDKQNLLLGHLKLLIKKNEVLNLTRITDFESAVILHIEDSLSIYEEFSRTSGEFCDIGTGGGFPGLPLAIATGKTGILLDSVQKKARAVGEFAEELGIEQVQAIGKRSEELALEMPNHFGCVVARALASVSAVIELATPLLRVGGRLIMMRANETDEEIAKADKIAERLGLEKVSEREFFLGPDRVHRRILVYEKVRRSKVKLPRRPGMAVKKPLT